MMSRTAPNTGTDGYIVYGLDVAEGSYDDLYDTADGLAGDQSHLPAYITGIARANTAMWSGNGNFGQMEDSDNGNTLTSVPLLAKSTQPQTYTIQRTAGAAFRLTILVASDGGNVTHTTTVQDGVDQETQNAAHAANGLHYHVYDVEAGSGDVTVTVQSSPSAFHVTGFAFDSSSSSSSPISWSDLSVSNVTATTADVFATLYGTNANVTAYWEAGVVVNPATHTGWDGSNGPAAESTGTVQRAATALTADTLYSYAFYATNTTLSADAWSSAATFATSLSDAQAPDLSNVMGFTISIVLGWQNNASNLTGFVLQRSDSGVGVSYTTIANPESTAISYIDGGLTPDTTYYYQLAATNRNNSSATLFSLARTQATTTEIGPDPDPELNYANTQFSVGSAWRTAFLAKPFDLDKNDVLGSDGYYVIGANERTSQPAYIASWLLTTTVYPGNTGYASIDDPDVVPPGSATIQSGTANPEGNDILIFSFVLGGTVPEHFRLGMMMDGLNDAKYNPNSVYLKEIGGLELQTASVNTTAVSYNDKNPDWIFFDVIGFTVGSEVGVYSGGGGNTLQVFAFDSAPPPTGTIIYVK